MPTYYYSAKAINGRNETGTMSAESVRELSDALKNNGLVLIRAIIEDNKKKSFLDFLTPAPKISITDKLMITRNLQIMASTGLPLVKSFFLLAGQAKSKELKKALLDIKDEIGKGESLANSLGKYPEIFSEIFRNMIAVGEASGTLENVLQVLSLQIEKDHQLRSKIRRALIYPAILLSVMLVVGAGDFMMQYWHILVLLALFLFPIIVKSLKTKKGKWIKDTILINLPFFNSLVKKSNSASLIRSLSSLISSGVPLVESLEITSRTVSNIYFENALNDAVEKIKKGEQLFSSLKEHKNIFPFGTIETIEIGEETGETSAILKKLADFYEGEVMDAADSLSVLIEPILIVFLGLAVGIFAFAVMSPLYSVLGTIH